MTVRRVGLFAVLLISTATAVWARTPNPGVQKQLQAHYQGMDQGWKRKDLRAVMEPLAYDYTWTLLDGKTYNRELSESVNQSILRVTPSIEGCSSRISRVSVNRDHAQVVRKLQYASTILGLKRKAHRFKYEGVTRDTWVQRGETWRLLSSVEVTAAATLDGKPIPPYRDPFYSPQPPQKSRH